MAQLNLSPLRTEQTCRRCKASMPVGALAFWSNIHKGWFHPKGPDGKCDLSGTSTDAPDTETPADMPPKSAPKSTPAPGSLDALFQSMIDARLGEWTPDAAISEDRVRQIVAEATAHRVEIEIKRIDGSKIKVAGEHYLFPRLVTLLGAGFSVYLYGPAGSGKTTAALRAGRAALGLDGEIDTLDAGTFKSAILGFNTAAGEFSPTAFTRCYTKGGAYIADECDNAPASVQTLFNSALANGHAPTAAGMVTRNPAFVFIGTGNTPGRPTPAFPDRKPMSAAFRDRLYFVHWPLDPNIERRACGRPEIAPPVRKVTTCEPAAWGEWVERTREWASKNAPTLMVTPRATLDGIKALALGETPAEVAEGLVFRGADPELVGKALAACPLP